MENEYKYPDGVRVKIQDINGESILFIPYDYETDPTTEGEQITSKNSFFYCSMVSL